MKLEPLQSNDDELVGNLDEDLCFGRVCSSSVCRVAQVALSALAMVVFQDDLASSI